MYGENVAGLKVWCETSEVLSQLECNWKTGQVWFDVKLCLA